MGLYNFYFENSSEYQLLMKKIKKVKIFKTTGIKLRPEQKELGNYYKVKKRGKLVYVNIQTRKEYSATKNTLMEGTKINFSYLRSIYWAALYFVSAASPNAYQLSKASGINRSTCTRKNGIFQKLLNAAEFLDSDAKFKNWRNNSDSKKAVLLVRRLYKKNR